MVKPGNDFVVANKWLFILFSAVTVLYLNNISGEFVWDDRTYFLDNDILPYLKPWNIREILLFPSNYWGELLPVRDLLYVVEYQLFGSFTTGYHVVSLIIYLLTGSVLYLFLERLYADAKCTWSALPVSYGTKLQPLLVTAFFLLHPAHVEAVAYISGQKDLLFGLFSSLALYVFYDSSVKNDLNLKKFALAVVFYYLSVLSKLTAVTTAIFIAVLWLFFLRKQNECFFKKAAVWTAFNIPVALWVFYSMSFSKGAMSADQMLPVWDRTVRALKILGAHLLLVLKPFTLSFGYPFDSSVRLDGNFWTGIVFIALIMVSAFLRKEKMAVFGLLLFLIYMLPSLQFIVTLSNAAIYDRYLFLPVLGIGIGIERLASLSVMRWQWTKGAIVALWVLVLISLSVLTYRYVPSFKNDVVSTHNSYQQFPEWPTSSFNYVYALIEAGRLNEALDVTMREKTFESPAWVRSYFIGWIHLNKGEEAEALKFLEQSSYMCMIGGYFPFPDIPLARILIERGDYKRARVLLENVMKSKIHQPVEFYQAKKMLEALPNAHL